MDGHAAQGLLTAAATDAGGPSRLDLARFDLARASDDAEIRRILRENVMAGAIRLSQEPAAGVSLADREPGELLRQVVVGRRDEHRLFGFGVRSVRTMYVDGQPTPVGYLGALRVDADHRAGPRTLLRGYELFRRLHQADGACRLYLTSIMADNHVARRVLEANLRGMPTYRFASEYVTLVMRVRRRREDAGVERLPAGDPRIAAATGRLGERLNFAAAAPVAVGFAVRDQAVGVLVDPTHARQTIVRGYAPWLGRLRPVLNAVGALTRRPRLPAVGEPLRLAFAGSLWLSDGAEPRALTRVVDALHVEAAWRGFDYLAAGFPADDARLKLLRRHVGGRVLRSRLYVVYWPDGATAADALSTRPAGPEVSLL